MEEDDAVEAVLAPYVAVPDTSETAFDQGLLKKDFDAVRRQVADPLPRHHGLRYADNLKFREIAERLHEPLDTVKSRHRRGLALLRNIADAGDFAVNH